MAARKIKIATWTQRKSHWEAKWTLLAIDGRQDSRVCCDDDDDDDNDDDDDDDDTQMPR